MKCAVVSFLKIENPAGNGLFCAFLARIWHVLDVFCSGFGPDWGEFDLRSGRKLHCPLRVVAISKMATISEQDAY
jgi:hypothetical protein